jgi:hypothetical protein
MELICDLCGELPEDCHCGDWEPWRGERSDEETQGLKTDESEGQECNPT